jgi:apolipoprotein D and lipocalin family protein
MPMSRSATQRRARLGAQRPARPRAIPSRANQPRATLLRAALLAALLAGCAPPAPETSRDPGAMIASAALFDPARFADVWHIVAALGPEAGCGPLTETWIPEAPGRFAVTGTFCGPSGARAFAATADLVGPGRFRRPAREGDDPLWVLWVDADYRVAVIGTPSGRFARILARRPDPRPDLIAAAREVLDFNGYALAGLRPL